jgi:hypothetical protein
MGMNDKTIPGSRPKLVRGERKCYPSMLRERSRKE